MIIFENIQDVLRDYHNEGFADLKNYREIFNKNIQSSQL
jgi:hypothetical protein